MTETGDTEQCMKILFYLSYAQRSMQHANCKHAKAMKRQDTQSLHLKNTGSLVVAASLTAVSQSHNTSCGNFQQHHILFRLMARRCANNAVLFLTTENTETSVAIKIHILLVHDHQSSSHLDRLRSQQLVSQSVQIHIVQHFQPIFRNLRFVLAAAAPAPHDQRHDVVDAAQQTGKQLGGGDITHPRTTLVCIDVSEVVVIVWDDNRSVV